MCGIAGISMMDGSRPDDALLDRLSNALVHRGPDGQGRHVRAGAGLLQVRLAIIDLESGDQPIYGPGGADGPALVANGEIYNYRELRQSLKDCHFKTQSDCEPPLHLYMQHGLDFVRHLRGMYAIAIDDPVHDRIVLARDPFGIKPLYYAQTAQGLAFASEAQALVAAGLVTPSVVSEKRDELLQLQFTTGRQTPFEHIQRVLPGEVLVIREGRIVKRHHHAALPEGGVRGLSEADALKVLDDYLMESVTLHQRADVDYGMFLSGGIDSSAILAMMARLNVRPVHAFTAGFDGTGVPDEREQARRAAASVGAEHDEVSFSEKDFWSLLPRVAATMDDPAADYAILPTYKLAMTAREAGLKVILSGEGGDELFGGYGRYRRASRWRLFGGRPMRSSGVMDDLGLLRKTPAGWRNGIAEAERHEGKPHRTRLQVAQAVDIADWLPNDLLTKLDRCLMAHGVEGRVPFIDPVLADFAFRLPDRLKTHRRMGKWLLRKWLETAMPESRPYHHKMGFTVPVGDWIAMQGGRVGALLVDQPVVQEVFDPEVVGSLFKGLSVGGDKKHGQAAWNILFYTLWHLRHIEGRTVDGGVFDVLASRA
ncbi:MAG: asparagine synthase (glutamine-hydrolyzing) [Rhodospirillales bacterium]|nr:asparagine synthase (glutamine-hydrolyzing) [Rhodospirillales bacterium]